MAMTIEQTVAKLTPHLQALKPSNGSTPDAKGIQALITNLVTGGKIEGVSADDLSALRTEHYATLLAAMQNGNSPSPTEKKESETAKIYSSYIPVTKGKTVKVTLASDPNKKVILTEAEITKANQQLKGLKLKLSENKEELEISLSDEDYIRIGPENISKDIWLDIKAKENGVERDTRLHVVFEQVLHESQEPPYEILREADKTTLSKIKLGVGEELSIPLERIFGFTYTVSTEELEILNKSNEHVSLSLSDNGKNLIVKGLKKNDKKQSTTIKDAQLFGNKKLPIVLEISEVISHTLRNVGISGILGLAGLASAFGFFKFGDSTQSKVFGTLGGLFAAASIPLFLWLEGFIGGKSKEIKDSNETKPAQKPEGKSS